MDTSAKLYYFADPMCSWCYGFAPVIDRIRAEYANRFDIRLVMGGLRPGGHGGPRERGAKDGGTRSGKLAQQMTPAIGRVIRHHWREVAKMTGQKFDETFFDRENFNYDTEPASKAVIVMEQLAGEHAYDYYHEVQSAFYSRNQDVTAPAVLAEIAAKYGVATETFLQVYHSEAAHRETWDQFQFSAKLGIRGFPALVAEINQQFYLVTRGWQPYEQIQAAIEQVLKTATAANAAGESCEIGKEC